MKVALIHYRLLHKGGLETRLINYMNYFLERGDEVTVICAKQSKEVKVPEGVRVLKAKLGIMPKLYRKRYFNHKLGKIMEREKFDFSLSLGRTSHQQMVLAPGNHLGYLAAYNRKSKGTDDNNQILLDQLSFDHSKAIFAASKMIGDEVIHMYGISPDKVKVLFPPLNTTKFNQSKRPHRDELREKFGIGEDKIAFVFVSASHSRKGMPILLEVWKQLPANYELLVAGDKVNTNLPNIKSLGYIRNTDELYTAGDYTIHPATYEPFGQIISESLACGTPVLVSHQVGAKEVVSDKEGIVINSFEPKAWLEAILKLDKNQFSISPDFAKEHRLSLENHMEKMLEVWRKVSL